MNKLGRSFRATIKGNLITADGNHRLCLYENVMWRITRSGDRSMWQRFTSPLTTYLRSFYHDQSPK